jgi:Secretion system C-terminal sorting domain
VPVSNEYTWTFDVTVSTNEVAMLQWNSSNIAIGSAELYLYDESTQTLIDMKSDISYSFDARVSSKFKIYYGENIKDKIKPQRVLLGAAYPNPSSGLVTIPFSLPEISGKLSVRLEIFDLMGRKVATLAHGDFEGGFFKREWQVDDNQVVNGLYTYRLVAGDEVHSGKVVLKK